MPEISPAAMKFLRQRVNLRHLRLVLVLDEERSITRTAERLCISQAAVSKTRAEFEKGIGAPLFEWFGNRLEVTPLGKCVLLSARRILAELECLSDEFAQMSSGMRGVLSIGTRTVSGQPFISRVTAAFKAAHPAVTVELLDIDMASLMERLAKGSISLLFGRYDATFASASVEAHAILSDRNVVLASPYSSICSPAQDRLVGPRQAGLGPHTGWLCRALLTRVPEHAAVAAAAAVSDRPDRDAIAAADPDAAPGRRFPDPPAGGSCQAGGKPWPRPRAEPGAVRCAGLALPDVARGPADAAGGTTLSRPRHATAQERRQPSRRA